MTVDQHIFTQALLDPELPAPQGVVDAKGRPAGKRFDVYRNNVIFSLLEAMRSAFPAIEKMIGPNNFRNLSGEFVRKHPPRTPMLMFYGADFPEFLAQVTQLEHYPHLADIARLEMARRVSYHAADVRPIDPAILGKIAAGDLMASQFHFSPALQIVQSNFPIVDHWEYHMDAGTMKPADGPQNALLYRPEFDPQILRAPDDLIAFIILLRSGTPLSTALEAMAETHPEFDFSAALGTMIQTEIITKISL